MSMLYVLSCGMTVQCVCVACVVCIWYICGVCVMYSFGFTCGVCGSVICEESVE